MAHVAPHRWADLDAGRVTDREREALERHARDCQECAAERELILATRGVFGDMRDVEPAELRWDHIGARIYWVTSSERRAAARHRDRRPSWRSVWIAAGAACSLAIAGLVTARLLASRPPIQSPPVTAEGTGGDPPVAESAPGTSPDRPTSPEPLVGVMTFLQGEVRSGDAPLEFDRPLSAGDVLVSGNGRIAVQFGPDSGFELGPNSVLTVRALDSKSIELGVTGSIDVDIATRRDGQTFAIVAGDRRVVVRGTAFRVDHRDERLDVSCLRGRVVVTDGPRQMDVAAGERLILAIRTLAEDRARRLSDDELEALDRSLSIPLLPAWTAADALYATSSTLDVRASAGQQVEVDGVRVGDGQLRMRMMSGRHQVADTWVDLAAGMRAQTVVATRSPPAATTRKSDRRARRKQLERAVAGNSRVRQCLRPLEKLELIEGSFVELDIGINADGTQGHLNIVKSNVPPQVQRCLRDVVDQVSFPPGPKAELRYRLSF